MAGPQGMVTAVFCAAEERDASRASASDFSRTCNWGFST